MDRISINAGAVDPTCAAVVDREFAYEYEARVPRCFVCHKHIFEPRSRTGSTVSNDVAAISDVLRVTKFCSYSPAKTHGQKIDHGLDNKFRDKGLLRIYVTAYRKGQVNASGIIHYEAYHGPLRFICRKRG